MSIAAFVLGVIGVVLSAFALSWQALSYRCSGRKPHLVAIIALQQESNLVVVPASADAVELVQAAGGGGDRVLVGVEVSNRGRSALHISGWLWRSDPAGISVNPPESLGQTTPYDIPPGATATFLCAPDILRDLARELADRGISPSNIYPYVISGGRMFTAKQFSTSVAALFTEPDTSDNEPS